MNTTRQVGGIAVALLLSIPALAHADSTVDRYRVDPHGQISGLILTDGTEIVASPSQAPAILSAVLPGDPIRLPTGPRNTFEVVDTRSGQFINLGPVDSVARGGGPISTIAVPYQQVDNATALKTYAVDGFVSYLTHTPNGVGSGFVMANGAQVHIVPGIDGVLRDIHPGQRLHVEGRGTQTPYGLGLWAMAITRPDRLVILDMTRGIGAPEIGL